MTFTRPNRNPDWCDTVYGPMNVKKARCRELFESALREVPAWLSTAMAVRNLVVSPFGLKTQLEGEGHFLTRMPVVKDEIDYYETGIDDHHLSFTLALKQHSGSAYLTTNIWFNSWLGKTYLVAVTPGHILATRQMISKVAKPVQRTLGGFEKAMST